MSVLTNRSHPQSISGSKIGNLGWSEDETDQRVREKRLRDRLKKWEKGDNSLLDELPKLSSNSEDSVDSQHPDIVFIGGSNPISSLPLPFGPGLTSRASISRRGSSDPEANSRFFRTSILVPNVRSLTQERSCRVERRQEINELAMRMGVGAIGGVLGQRERTVGSSFNSQGKDRGAELLHQGSDEERMWEDWGRRVEVWANVRQIADRAVGNVIAAGAISNVSSKVTLDPTAVPWSIVHHAWATLQSSSNLRKAWAKVSSAKTSGEQEEHGQQEEHESPMSYADSVVEGVKQDPDLDPHEQRLLPCIVDPGKVGLGI
jgi:hypothetical protein